MIPNIIHQIWIQGYDKIPLDLRDNHIICKNINDNFEYIFWDENKIKKLLSDHFDKKYLELYNSYVMPVQRADLARYVILYVYGGIYLDMDMICKKNLSHFLKLNLFFTIDIFYNLYKRYLTGIIGAKNKHPLFLVILENMIKRKKYAYYYVPYSSGTQLFYDSVQQYIKNTNDNNISIIDRKYLHPCTILDDELCPYRCDTCYVAHINYSSWSPTLKIFKYVKKNIKIVLIIIIIIIFFLLIKYKFDWF